LSHLSPRAARGAPRPSRSAARDPETSVVRPMLNAFAAFAAICRPAGPARGSHYHCLGPRAHGV